MRSTLLPPPPPTKSRRSPRSAAANLTPQTTNLSRKKLNFDEFRKRLNFDDAVDESSFLAGFSSSLKFPDDDSWADQGGANPFREAKVAAAAAPTSTGAAITSSASAKRTDAPTNYFESNDPFEYPRSEAITPPRSEATTAVGSNLLADKLLSNINHDVMPPKPKQTVSPSKKAASSPNKVTTENSFVTPKNSPRKVNVHAPVRNWSRGKVKEELQRRSSSHLRERGGYNSEGDIYGYGEEVEEDSFPSSSRGSYESGRYKWKEDSRLGRSYRGRYYKSEKKDVPYLFSNKEDESTFCDETTFETNSLTYRDNVSAFTEDDSLTFLTPTPAPSSRRSRHSRRGGHGRFLCGCDDNDRMADTVKDLKGALRDINRSVLQILSPLKNARCYVGNMGKYHPADVRPTRGRSQHVKQRSRSVSVRRDRASSMTRSRRGKSCDPPRVVRL